MTYRPHRHVPDKERVIAGYKAALNNPSTTSEGRAHARKQLLKKGRIFDAFFSTSMSTRIRHRLGLRAKKSRR